ncbi:MAG: L-iditol 2-dehydrogenase [Acidihalobacter sp.]|uniref:L-iditol 2-dehydrogenase n=1 Tax=Acidihalobacter sp. TaxID=1872108 RepID=UPI00307ECA77
MRLKDKVALVTGGAQGIGLAISQGYAAEGAHVIIADINLDAAEQAAGEIGDRARAMHLNVTEQSSIDRVVGGAVAEFGRIDILVNNAAIFDLAPIEEVTRESFRRIMAVNVEGLFFMMQAVAKQMLENGKGGRIINMSSQAGRRGEPLVSAYCASKAAVISITQSAGLAFARRGINVNAIAPGVVDTPMWDTVDALFARYENRGIGEKKRLVGEAVPYGRMGRVSDYVGPAVFLASDESEYVVAQTLNVDGGNWMS